MTLSRWLRCVTIQLSWRPRWTRIYILYYIQAPSVCSSGRYSADCGRSGSPLHCGPSLISSGGGSTTATTGTSSFSLGALQTSYGANQQHRQQPMRTAPARYLPLADHTHDVGLECDGIQMQAAASITNEEVSRRPIISSTCVQKNNAANALWREGLINIALLHVIFIVENRVLHAFCDTNHLPYFSLCNQAGRCSVTSPIQHYLVF